MTEPTRLMTPWEQNVTLWVMELINAAIERGGAKEGRRVARGLAELLKSWNLDIEVEDS